MVDAITTPSVLSVFAADIISLRRHVCFTTKSGHVQCNSVCLLWAINVRFASRRHRSKVRFAIRWGRRRRTRYDRDRPNRWACL